jgi:uncharacterized membrane protein YgdD (TMEM256/DUF423 family)
MDVFVFDPDVHTLVSLMNAAPRWIVAAAGLLGFSGVALGAFGAHALKATLLANGTLATWQTAVLYQLVHAVALLALAGILAPARSAQRIASCWIGGVLLFSGSLYGLALGGPKWLGPVTPLGGLGFLVGWLLLMWVAFRKNPPA